MNICDMLRNINPIDKIGNYIRNLSEADKINEELSSCKTNKERIAILNAIRPAMSVLDKAVFFAHPQYIKVKATLP